MRLTQETVIPQQIFLRYRNNSLFARYRKYRKKYPL